MKPIQRAYAGTKSPLRMLLIPSRAPSGALSGALPRAFPQAATRAASPFPAPWRAHTTLVLLLALSAYTVPCTARSLGEVQGRLVGGRQLASARSSAVTLAGVPFPEAEASASEAELPQTPTEDSAYHAVEQESPQDTSKGVGFLWSAHGGGPNTEQTSEQHRPAVEPVSRRFNYSSAFTSVAKAVHMVRQPQPQEGVSRRFYYSVPTTDSPSRRLQEKTAPQRLNPSVLIHRDASSESGPINRQVFNLLKGRSYGKVYGRASKRTYGVVGSPEH